MATIDKHTSAKISKSMARAAKAILAAQASAERARACLADCIDYLDLPNAAESQATDCADVRQMIANLELAASDARDAITAAVNVGNTIAEALQITRNVEGVVCTV